MATEQRISEPTQYCGFPTSWYINLNVGGTMYTTSQETLTRYPDSMLGHMFTQERIPLAKDEQGRFVIDRDGTYFRYILNYLRDGELVLPEGFREHKQFLAEARFYQLEELVKELSIPLNVNDIHYYTSKAIITKHRGSLLKELFAEKPYPLKRDQDGRYTLRSDNDGHIFQYILNFLEHDDLHLPQKFDKFNQLEKEAKHYNLEAVARSLEICLTVGGHEYTTSRAVLTKKKGSLLEEIFSQTPIPLERDQRGRFVFQPTTELGSAGGNFRYIISFLEKGKVGAPKHAYSNLHQEARYYRLDELEKLLTFHKVF